jgi:hypothetical protein
LTAFELPYSVYRGLETSYGQKNSAINPGNNIRAPLFHDTSNRSATSQTPFAYDIDYNRFKGSTSISFIGTPAQILASYPRSAEWAPVYLNSLLGSAYLFSKNQNGGETPDRMGFVYEVPLRSDFWNGSMPRVNPFPNDTNKLSADNLNGRIERGPTWDLYRNYYRMYKLETEAW